MKDGYLQLKISELDEKLKQMNQEAKRIGMILDRLENEIGRYDIIHNGLKDLKKFKQEAFNDVVEANKKHIDKKMKSMLLYLGELIKEVVKKENKSRFKEISNYIEELQVHDKKIDVYFEKTVEFSREVNMYFEILYTTLNKLVAKKILTENDARNIQK